MNIGTILKELRIQNGFSQAQLAEKVGVRTTVISRWETASVKPNLEVSIKLANALGVSMDVFCGIASTKASTLEKLAKMASSLPKNKVKALELVLQHFVKE